MDVGLILIEPPVPHATVRSRAWAAVASPFFGVGSGFAEFSAKLTPKSHDPWGKLAL
jgi:hypothetical protein